MGVVLVLMVMGLFVVGFAALIGGIIYWARKTTKKRHEIWAAVARQHGLSYAGAEAQGVKYGQRVRIRTERRGSGDNQSTYTVVSAKLPMPFDLGLNVRHHGFFNDMFHRSVDIQIGDAAFDQAFIVSADEEHRARAALTPPLRQLLLGRLGDASFRLTDAGMSVECAGATQDASWLNWAVELCARAAHKLDAARVHVPVAGPLRGHRHGWLAYAETAGLRGQDTPLCMWGRLEPYDIVAQTVRVDRLRYALDVRVQLPRPLGVGLSVKQSGMMDSVATFFGGQDLRLGDPVFDDCFRVRTSDPARAREMLDGSVRQALLWVRAHVGPPIVDDHGISVRLPTVPQAPNVVPSVVQQLTGLCERLSARRRDPTGVYR